MTSPTYEALIAKLREAAALASELEAERAALEPTEPPIIVDPPLPAPGADDMSLADAPFADVAPPLPKYVIPTEEDCDWIVTDRHAVSRRGLPNIEPDGEGNVIGFCYRRSVDAGHTLPVTVGVRGNGGRVVVGGEDWHTTGKSVTKIGQDGAWADVRLRVVGLEPDAEVSPRWRSEWGFGRQFELFNLGLRGAPDQFIMRATDNVGDVIMDGCWLLSHPSVPMHQSGLHLNGWDTLVIRRMQYRGTRVAEHPIYLKSGRELTCLWDNDLRGGNRSWFQKRPGRDETYLERPLDTLVIAYNDGDSYGWDHDAEDGGAAISVWSSPEAPTFIYRNRVRDARYGGLMVGAQGSYNGVDRNWYNANGYAIGHVYVASNHFENMRSPRASASISGVEHLHWYGDNVLSKPLVLDSDWHKNNANGPKTNGAVDYVG